MALTRTAKTVQMDRGAILAERQATQEPAAAGRASGASTGTLRLAEAPAARPAHLAPRTRRSTTPTPAESGGGGTAVTLLLTEEQWAWVRSEAERRKIAQRYVLLDAVERHREAIAEHFQTRVEEGASLFRWRGEPKDVDGGRVGAPVRIPAGERETLRRLVDEAGAPSLSFYLRVAADLAMSGR